MRRTLFLAVNLAFSTLCSIVSSGLADAPCAPPRLAVHVAANAVPTEASPVPLRKAGF